MFNDEDDDTDYAGKIALYDNLCNHKNQLIICDKNH